eukprot:COSAG04_NODE_9702_length_839_cov_0.962162_1_plen_123_part_01
MTWTGADTRSAAQAEPQPQSALLGSVDLATAPSLRGAAVYVALRARLPVADTARLTLAIDAGDGEWRYSDDYSDDSQDYAGNDGSAPRGEWSTFSYQAVLRMNGMARFAAFRHAGNGEIMVSG